MSLVACTHDLANIIDRENSKQYSFNELSDNWIGMDLFSTTYGELVQCKYRLFVQYGELVQCKYRLFDRHQDRKKIW
jgi:hypothetical protein